MAGPNYSGLLLDMAAQPESGPPQPDWTRRLTPFLPPPDPSFGLRDNPYAQGVARGIVGIGQGIATLPQRAFQASENMRQGGDYDPGPVLGAAMLPMGTGALARVPMRAGEAALGAGPIRAKVAAAEEMPQPRIVSSSKMQEAVLRNTWQRHGPDLDFDDIWQTRDGYRTWLREIKEWNKAHGTHYDEDSAFNESKQFRDYFEGKYLAGKKAPFPGVKEANEHFENSGNLEHAAYLPGEVPE